MRKVYCFSNTKPTRNFGKKTGEAQNRIERFFLRFPPLCLCASMCVCACLCLNTCMYQVQSEEGIKLPGTAVTDGCDPPCGCRPKSKSSAKAPVLLTAGPSLLPRTEYFWRSPEYEKASSSWNVI